MASKFAPFTELLSAIIDNRGRTCPVGSAGLPLIATNCVSNDTLYPSYETTRFVDEETYRNWFRGHPEPGDILFVCKGSPGRTNLVPSPVDFCIAQDMVAVRADPEKIYPNYLFAVLRSSAVQKQIDNMHVGTLIPHFKKGDFDKLRIPLMDEKEQARIGDLYFEMSRKIDLNRRINQTIEAMAQAIFKSWFVDFDPVKAKIAAIQEGSDPLRAAMSAISGKPDAELDALPSEQYAQLAATAALFPDGMEESELGKIPRGWRVSALGEFLTIKRGGSPRPIQEFMAPSGLPWVKIADATAEASPFLFDTREFIKESGLKKTVYLECGALILTNSATPGLPKFLDLHACIHDGWLYFPEKRHFTDQYLYFLFQKIRSELVAQGNGSVFTNLKTDILRGQRVLVPAHDVMTSFTTLAGSILEKIKSLAKEGACLSALRDTLLSKLLSGELSVADAIAEAEA